VAEFVWRSDKRKTLVYWPEIVDERLDLLHRLAERAGEQTSRAQILAALVCAAPPDGEGLGVMIREYRRLTVVELREQLPGPQPELRRPGPRRYQ
jgi:hypothetical protein